MREVQGKEDASDVSVFNASSSNSRAFTYKVKQGRPTGPFMYSKMGDTPMGVPHLGGSITKPWVLKKPLALNHFVWKGLEHSPLNLCTPDLAFISQCAPHLVQRCQGGRKSVDMRFMQPWRLPGHTSLGQPSVDSVVPGVSRAGKS